MIKKLKGMALEEKINQVNLDYRKLNKALIIKKSTPLKVTSRGVIYQMSTVDFSGLYKSRTGTATPIAFDAKECKSKSSFPLTNIEEHQILFLDMWSRLDGEAFILIDFTELNKTYKVPITYIIDFKLVKTRKSIPLDDFKSEWLVDLTDYLGIK